MRKRLILFVLIALILVVAAVSVTFFSPKKCESYECFKDSMAKCSRAKYLNEAQDATWKYEILGLESKECKVKVTLLQVKTGNKDIERLSGYNMECSFSNGAISYPEKDLSKCHGRLKEELQTVTINKLYNYILENLGEIKSGLENILG